MDREDDMGDARGHDSLSRRHLIYAATAGGVGVGLLHQSTDTARADSHEPTMGAALVNVKDPYFRNGAVGDGSVDDAPAIQTAINFIGFVGGGIVHLPPGRYRVDSTLTVPSGVHLTGIGSDREGSSWAGTSYIYAGSGLTEPVVENASSGGNHNIVLRGLRIGGARSSASNPPAVRFAANVSYGIRRVLIEDCRIVRGGRASLELERAQLCQVRNCMIGGDGHCEGAGLSLVSSPDNHILGNQITTGSDPATPGQGGTGLKIDGASNVIEGNMVFWSDRGLEVLAPLCTVLGNRIEMNMSSGIYLTPNQGCTVTGNSIYLNGAGGPDHDIGAGIELANSASGIVMSGNLLANWNAWEQTYKQRYGIVYRGSSSSANNAATGNVFQDMEIADTHNVP